MKKQFADYRWLAGGHGMKGSLWEGPDHVLVIEARGFLLPYREVYRRLDYKNIQAISMGGTSRYVWIAALLIPLCILLCVGWVFTFRSYGLNSGVGLFALAPLAVLALLCVHLYKGGTARCAIQTAVQFLPLKMLRRQRTALPILEKLHAAALRHQGEISPGLGAPAAAYPSPSAPLYDPSINRPVWPGSVMSRICMGFFLLWGLMFAGKALVPGTLYLIAQGVVAAIAMVLIIILLAQLSRYLLPKKSLRAILILELLTIFVAGITCFVMAIIAMVDRTPPAHGQVPFDLLMDSLGDVTLWNGGSAYLIFVALGLGAAVLGALGFPATSPHAPVSLPDSATPEPPRSNPNSGSWP